MNNDNLIFDDAEMKEFEKSCAEERKKHPYKSRFRGVGIANAFGSIVPESFDEFIHLLHGYDCQYAVTNKGRVLSFSSGRQLMPGVNEHSYLHVGLMKDGKEQTVKISTLVATAFCKNALHKDVIHHVDRDPSNNAASNLLWVTTKQHKELHWALKSGNDDVYYAIVSTILEENEGRCQ